MEVFLTLLTQIVWLLLPAGAANMAPVLFKWLPVLNVPIDFGHTFRGKRIFGAHKTYRGFLVGFLLATLVVWIQTHVKVLEGTQLLSLQSEPLFLFGFIFGFGALAGDSIKSFFKRQVGIDSGEMWFPFDQIDWVVGVYTCLFAFGYAFAWPVYVVSLLVAMVLHPFINLLGYYLGIKQNKF